MLPAQIGKVNGGAMKVEKIAAIGEIVSSVAIVATLAYLAVQTEQNTQAIRATAIQGLAEQDMTNTNQLVAYPEIIDFLMTSRELKRDEAGRLYGWLTGFVRSRESYYRQYMLGVIDEESYQRMEGPFLGVLNIEHINNYWQSQKAAFDGAFVERIDSLIAGRETIPGNDEFVEFVFGRPE
jgi:hypothetical protein